MLQRTFVSVAVYLGAGMFAGCSGAHSQSAGPPAHDLHAEAPFRTHADGQLTLRADLAERLRVARAGPAETGATLEGFGYAEFAPGASYAVRTPFNGYAERVHVRVGDHVETGTVLATLRSSDVARMRADVRRLSANLATERDGLERIERLISENAASTREAAVARGQIDALEAELAGLREALSAARAGTTGADQILLRAQQAGDVLARFLEPGERIEQGDSEPAFLIGNSSSLLIAASFPERDAAFLANDARCDVTIPALGTMFEGRVVSLVHAIDPSTRTARVFCAPNDLDPRLRAQMVARIAISVPASDALVVPRSAVLLRNDERVVFVRRGPDVVERRVVTTGATLAQNIQILSGLRAGEDVVVEGAVLFDGALDQLL